MTRRALIIVDTQPTFCEGGELPVEGGNRVAADIAAYLAEHRSEYAAVVTTQDWHIDPGHHFAAEPDYVDTWPPHGIAGSASAELHPAIAGLEFDAGVKKGAYEPAYSGFEGLAGGDRSLEEILRSHGIEALDVVGIALSHCVKQTALDGARLGWPVRVIERLTVPVTPEQGVQAVADLKAAGVEIA